MDKRDERRNTVCFTGHRTIDKELEDYLWFEVKRVLITTNNYQITTVYNGGARGFDLIAAEAVIELKKRFNFPKKLIMVLPHSGYYARWNFRDKIRILDILSQSDEVIYLSDRYYKDCMKDRKKYLVEHSGICIAYMERKYSGTGQTVRLAEKNNLQIINLAQLE